MECRDVRTRLSAYGDGELPEAVAANVRAHLVVCNACAREAAALAQLSDLVSHEAPPKLDRAFMAAVRSRIASRCARSRAPAPTRPLSFLLRGAVAAAIVIGAIVLGATLGQRTVSPAGSGPAGAVATASGLGEWRVGAFPSAPRTTVGGAYVLLTGADARTGRVR